MDLSKIKNLVKQNGDKFIFLDNGEPEVVMMSWREYQKLFNNDSNNHYSDHSVDKFESPLGAKETEFISPVLAESVGLPIRLEDIRLEDLPI